MSSLFCFLVFLHLFQGISGGTCFLLFLNCAFLAWCNDCSFSDLHRCLPGASSGLWSVLKCGWESRFTPKLDMVHILSRQPVVSGITAHLSLEADQHLTLAHNGSNSPPRPANATHYCTATEFSVTRSPSQPGRLALTVGSSRIPSTSFLRTLCPFAAVPLLEAWRVCAYCTVPARPPSPMLPLKNRFTLQTEPPRHTGSHRAGAAQ